MARELNSGPWRLNHHSMEKIGEKEKEAGSMQIPISFYAPFGSRINQNDDAFSHDDHHSQPVLLFQV